MRLREASLALSFLKFISATYLTVKLHHIDTILSMMQETEQL